MTVRAKSSALMAAFLASSGVLAAEKTITLNVDNMYCASCAPIVKKSLQQILGVSQVAVSQKRNTATVTYDDAKVSVEALITATKNAGYPSRLACQK